MCGIAGIIDYGARSQVENVRRMNQTLAHRGPDDGGLWHSGIATIGHRRLKILDLTDQAAQPMIAKQSGLVLSYNGEIYNYLELRTKIGGRVWNSTGDTEVLLRAYERWGERCLEKLNGMFAFAIWDERNQRLFAARDRFGIKPFYYAQLPDRFIFASEIKAILAAGVQPVANFHKVGEFLRWGALDYSSETWFEGIYSLPAGHCLTLEEGQLTTESYYYLPDHVDESVPIGLDEASECFSSLLKDALALQIRSDRQVGVHLSGGVDSSIVTAIAAASYPGKLTTYTFGYEEELYDERPFAEGVAKAMGVSNHSSILCIDDVATWLPRTIREEDEPFTSFRQLSHHKLYADFAEDGSTVILEASAGDECGAGYSSYLWPWYLDQVKVDGPSKSKDALVEMAKSIGMGGKFLLQFLLGSAANYEQSGVCTSDGIPYLDPAVLNPEFVKTYGKACLSYPKPFKSNLRNFQFIDLMYTKLPRGLRYIERASMASSREARLPLLDHRIVEFGFSAENSAKIGGGHLRRFMKNAARTLLPGDLLDPNKRSVADPQKAWLRGPAFEMVWDVFSSRSFAERGIVDTEQARQSYQAFCKADPLANSLGIFQLFMVELWFQFFIDGRAF